MTGAATMRMSWMKVSASHFIWTATFGATSPRMIPATMATMIQNQSFVAMPPWYGFFAWRFRFLRGESIFMMHSFVPLRCWTDEGRG